MKYHVKKISDSEYHVILQEYENVEPHVYAICKGPVSAHEIKTALNLVSTLDSTKFSLLNMASRLKSNAEKFRQDIDDLKKYDEIKAKLPNYFDEKG